VRNYIAAMAVDIRNALPSYMREDLDECDDSEGIM